MQFVGTELPPCITMPIGLAFLLLVTPCEPPPSLCGKEQKRVEANKATEDSSMRA